MSEKLLFAFKSNDKEEVIFEVGESSTLLQTLLAIVKLKQVAFNTMEELDMLQKIEYDMETEEDKERLFIQIIKAIEENHIWKDELLN